MKKILAFLSSFVLITASTSLEAFAVDYDAGIIAEEIFDSAEDIGKTADRSIDFTKYQPVSGYNSIYKVMSLENHSENGSVSAQSWGNNLFIVNRQADEMMSNVYHDIYVYDVFGAQLLFSAKGLTFDSYRVCGDKLVTWSVKERNLTVYDSTLSILNEYSLKNIITNDDDWYTFYPAYDDSSIIYIFDNNKRQVYRLEAGDTISWKKYSLPFNYPTIHRIYADGRAIIYGTNSDNYISQTYEWDIPNSRALKSDRRANIFALADDYCAQYTGEVNTRIIGKLWDSNKKLFTIDGYNEYSTMFLEDNLDICITASEAEKKTIRVYDINGKNKFSYNLRSEDNYYSPFPIPNTNAYCIINNRDYSINILDCSNLPKGADASVTPYTESKPSMVGNEKSLTQLYEKAIRLGEKLGINIYIGDTVINECGGYNISQCFNKDDIDKALDIIDSVYSEYPEDFFEQLKIVEIADVNFYLTDRLENKETGGVDLAGAFVYTDFSSQEMDVCIDVADSSGLITTLNHETAHMIDFRLQQIEAIREDSLYKSETWDSYNPSDFSYAYSYENYWEHDYDERYFYSSYGVTYPTEDRAELFGFAMTCYYDPAFFDVYFIRDKKPAMKKMQYYCECIRDAFDSKDWAKVLPWEAVINYDDTSDEYITPFKNGEIFTIKNLGSGKFLNVDNGLDINGANVYQWEGDNSKEQKFRMELLSSGEYRIRAMCSSDGKDKTLDIVKENGNVVSLCNVEIYEPVDEIAQEWLFVRIKDNIYKIVPKYNTDLALTAVGKKNGTSEGTTCYSDGNVYVNSYVGSEFQKWIIGTYKEPSAVKPPPPVGKVSLGDIDGDGSINAVDASIILTAYAELAVSGSSSLNDEQKKCSDVNNDGAFNAIDASLVLTYYAHISVGGTGTLAEFLKK